MEARLKVYFKARQGNQVYWAVSATLPHGMDSSEVVTLLSAVSVNVDGQTHGRFGPVIDEVWIGGDWIVEWDRAGKEIEVSDEGH